MKLITRKGWYYLYHDRRHIISLKTKDKDVAREMLATAKADAKKGKVVQFERKRTIRLSEFEAEYTAARVIDVDRMTIKNDKLAFTKFREICGDIPMRQVDRKIIDNFKATCLGLGLSKTYVNILLRALRAGFNTAMGDGYVEKNYFLQERGKPPVIFRMDDEIPHFLFEEEIKALFDKISDSDFALAVNVYLYSGVRRAELVRLNAQDIDLKNGLLYIRHTKTKKDRAVPICDELRAILEGGVKFNIGPLFPRWTSPDTLSRIFKEYADAAGIKHTLKDLRHTFGSYLRMRGADLDTIRKLMGHTDIKTTLIYAKVTDEHTKAAVNKLKFGTEGK